MINGIAMILLLQFLDPVRRKRPSVLRENVMHSRHARRAEHAIGALQKFWLLQATVLADTISCDRVTENNESSEGAYMVYLHLIYEM